MTPFVGAPCLRRCCTPPRQGWGAAAESGAQRGPGCCCSPQPPPQPVEGSARETQPAGRRPRPALQPRTPFAESGLSTGSRRVGSCSPVVGSPAALLGTASQCSVALAVAEQSGTCTPAGLLLAALAPLGCEEATVGGIPCFAVSGEVAGQQRLRSRWSVRRTSAAVGGSPCWSAVGPGHPGAPSALAERGRPGFGTRL